MNGIFRGATKTIAVLTVPRRGGPIRSSLQAAFLDRQGPAVTFSIRGPTRPSQPPAAPLPSGIVLASL